MKIRLCIAVLASVVLLSGCLKDKRKSEPARKDKASVPTKDQSNDVSFQSFVGQLKIAVANRDRAMLASMMAPNFGYRWDAAPAGEDPFQFWDKNNLWPELQSLMNERWVPHNGFMVVDRGSGYRAGLQQYTGAWRFAYFVPTQSDEPEGPAPTQL